MTPDVSRSSSQLRHDKPQLGRRASPWAAEVSSKSAGEPMVRVFATAKFSKAKARLAAQRIFAIGAKAKPSRKHGAQALTRSVRDGA